MPQLQLDMFGTRQFVSTTVDFSGAAAILGGRAPGHTLSFSNGSDGRTNVAGRLALSSVGFADMPCGDDLAHIRISPRLTDASPFLPIPGSNSFAAVAVHAEDSPSPMTTTTWRSPSPEH